MVNNTMRKSPSCLKTIENHMKIIVFVNQTNQKNQEIKKKKQQKKIFFGSGAFGPGATGYSGSRAIRPGGGPAGPDIL
jgi:hypothetical protein